MDDRTQVVIDKLEAMLFAQDVDRSAVGSAIGEIARLMDIIEKTKNDLREALKIDDETMITLRFDDAEGKRKFLKRVDVAYEKVTVMGSEQP